MIPALLSNLLRLLLLPIHALRRAFAAPRGAYVVLEIDGPVVDLPPPRGRFAFLRRPGKQPLSLAELRELGRMIALDDRVAGLFVELRSVGAGPAVVSSLRDVLLEVRASGKDLVCYLPLGADNTTLYLGSAARRLLVGPETMVAPLGFAMEGRYVRRALEQAGIEPEVFAKGMYKSAGEVLVRDTMSDEQREQVGALLEARHDALVTALAQGRRVDRATAARWIDGAPHGALHAKELGIVDAVAYEDEIEEHLALPLAPVSPKPEAATSAGAPPALPRLSAVRAIHVVHAARYSRVRGATRFRPALPGPFLGVIEVHGPIVSRARFELSRIASEERIVAAVRAARANPRVRGVLLHIDSPGGSALASDRIYHEVSLLAAVKPVVAYLSNVAASGGYYVAVAAHTIVAQPQTVTGSIGVISARFAVGPLLDRLGIFTDVVKRGARADSFSSARRLDEDERALVERELAAFYQTFLRVVAKGRGKPVEVIEPLAQGRVYSGTDAHTRGLLDFLGGFDRAQHELRELLGVRGKGLTPRILRAPRPLPPSPRLPASAQAAIEALGLGGAASYVTLAACLEHERVLAYWPG